MRLKGTVSSIVDFGAFVDLGGIDGLVHISELSWNHVNHPSEVVKVGDEVEVEVLDVDLQRERISLGLKQTTEEPWIKLVESYPVGSIVDGKVTKIVPFGAFIELGQSIEGLVHISEMAQRHIDTPAQVAKAGDIVEGEGHGDQPRASSHLAVHEGRRGRAGLRDRGGRVHPARGEAGQEAREEGRGEAGRRRARRGRVASPWRPSRSKRPDQSDRQGRVRRAFPFLLAGS